MHRLCAGRVISGSAGSSVYDYSRLRHLNISGSIDENAVGVYDHERSCPFSGTLPNLYDYGTKAHLTLTIKGNSFDGYDYGGKHHFSGSVSGSSVSIYDYGEERHFSYSL
jgi:hypothetical protein